MIYIVYKYRIKCPKCGDIIWTMNEKEYITCKCGDSSIVNGIPTNGVEVTDEDMLKYYNQPTEIIKVD